MRLICCFLKFSYVNREQKALIRAYAELDQDVNGTVDGLTVTTQGLYIVFMKYLNFFYYYSTTIIIVCLYFFVSDKSDGDGVLGRIKKAIFG